MSNEEESLLAKVYTKLGEMHSDIKTLHKNQDAAHLERQELRKDITDLQQTKAQTIGYVTGVAFVVTIIASIISHFL